MKILIAASIYPPDPGGPALHAKAQYEWFKKQGIGVNLLALADYRKFPKGIRHLIYFYKLLLNVHDCDVVYAHDAIGVGIPALIVARIFNKKFVVRVGGDIAWEREAEGGQTGLSLMEWYKDGNQRNSRPYKLSKWLLVRADLVIVSSPLLSNLYHSYYGVSDKKIVVIPNPTPERVDAHQVSGKTIVYASRLVAYKNLDFVLRVLAKVFEKHSELTFVVMGDGPEREHLTELAKKLNIENKVFFKGSLSQAEVLSYTSKCLFALAPALTEFNPNYILQSIAFSKPFLISRENSLLFPVPEQFVFNPRDRIELENKILNLLDETQYNTAKEWVKNLPRVSWEDNLKANLEALKSLLKTLK